MVRTTHSEILKALAKKLKEEIDFNRKPCFWPRDLWPFDLWPQKKDGHNPWGTIYLPCKFGKDPPTGSGLNRWGPPTHPPKKVLVIPSRRASLTLKGPAKLINQTNYMAEFLLIFSGDTFWYNSSLLLAPIALVTRYKSTSGVNPNLVSTEPHSHLQRLLASMCTGQNGPIYLHWSPDLTTDLRGPIHCSHNWFLTLT